MILRRLTESLRKQDWFTVVLEVMIVVVGIFIGLQVDDWNEARKDRANEARFLVQLTTEIKAEITAREEILDLLTLRGQTLASAIRVIQSDDPDVRLTEDQCDATRQSAIISVGDFLGLLSVAALAQSGKFDILSNGELRSALVAYERQMQVFSARTLEIMADVANIVDEHADLLPRRLAPGELIGRVECQLELLHSSQKLLNNLQSNLGRATGITGFVTTQIEMLQSLLQLAENGKSS